jgi:two-component system CheB/CheR fusion protein
MARVGNSTARAAVPPEAFFESLPTAAYFCTPDGRIRCYNQLAVELWGRRPDSSARYDGAIELRSPEGEAIVPADSCTALALRDRASLDGRLVVVVRPDGSRRTVSTYAHPVRDASGRVAGVTTVLVDVTERLATEAARRESERNFRGFFESAAIGAAQLDMNGRFARVNDRYCELTGYSREELLTMTPFELDHPDDVEVDRGRAARFAAAESGNEIYDTEKRYVRKDGRVIWVRVVAHLLRDEHGKPVQSAAIALDVTERKRFEQALERTDRMKNEFLSMLAHELRNPLAPLRNSVELLKHRGRSDEWTVNVVERQVNHLSRLVDDLLDVARMTKDKLELRRERVALMQVLEAATEAARSALDAHAQELVMVVPPGPGPYLDADPVRLAQVFTNLLLNAAKFSDHPGTVRITVADDDALVRVTVADSGSGLAPEDLSRVFEMFYQSPHGRAKDGLGIGLALVRRLVEMHGGTVGAMSAGLGRGSQFVVRLPVAAAAVASPALPAPRRRGTRKRILVVDDNRDAADSLCRLLSAMGHVASPEYDGREGLASACRQPPDVVLLDLSMPDCDGFEVCRRLRAEPTLTATLIVALTGWGREEDFERTQRAGFDAHLVKPADIKAIEAALERQPSLAADVAVAAGR